MAKAACEAKWPMAVVDTKVPQMVLQLNDHDSLI